MRRNRKADLRGVGSKPNLNGHLRNRFSVFNDTQSGSLVQCQKCGSDYMRFSLNGYCQRCLQRVEFIQREKLLRGGQR